MLHCLLTWMKLAVAVILITSLCLVVVRAGAPFHKGGSTADRLLPVNFPSEADTLAYVDALKHSNLSQWRSLEEVAKRAGGGSCSGALNTSVLTALYLLGLFNLCAASPASCCIPSLQDRRRRRRRRRSGTVAEAEEDPPPRPLLLDSLTQNLSSLSLGDLPHVTTPQGGRVPVHVSVVEQVRRLWDSNPRLLSTLPCTTATEAVRSSFISLSGVASGIILAYSIAQLNQCYPDPSPHPRGDEQSRVWFFPVPTGAKPPGQEEPPSSYLVRSLPPEMPVTGKDDPDDGCDRTSVRMGDGRCDRLLSSGMCPYLQWVLLNRETGQGECVPRLCSHRKVFVEKDQMCHDANEPGFCPDDQRLYITAWGEAVCDCIDGMFYGPDNKCHQIYGQAYCPEGAVLQFHKPSKTLMCKTDSCEALNNDLDEKKLPYAESENDTCYQFGSTGPCGNAERFGFDIESLEPSCVSLEEAGLLRSQRSYQYSHMSFPSAQDKDFPHYEVSYVIMNGSTWELMMKTVGRERRDVGEKQSPYSNSNNNNTVIPFFDTREFPTTMEDIVNKFKGLEDDEEVFEDVIEGMRGRVNGEDSALYTQGKRIKQQSVENKKGIKKKGEENKKSKIESMRRNGTKRREHYERRYGREKVRLDKKISRHRHRQKQPSEFARNDKETNFIKKSHYGRSVREGKKGMYFEGSNFFAADRGIEIKNNFDNGKKIELKKDVDEENEGKLLIKVFKNSKNCKWHISFYSQIKNISNLNDTTVNNLQSQNIFPLKFQNSNFNTSFDVNKDVYGGYKADISSEKETEEREQEEERIVEEEKQETNKTAKRKLEISLGNQTLKKLDRKLALNPKKKTSSSVATTFVTTHINNSDLNKVKLISKVTNETKTTRIAQLKPLSQASESIHKTVTTLPEVVPNIDNYINNNNSSNTNKRTNNINTNQNIANNNSNNKTIPPFQIPKKSIKIDVTPETEDEVELSSLSNDLQTQSSALEAKTEGMSSSRITEKQKETSSQKENVTRKKDHVRKGIVKHSKQASEPGNKNGRRDLVTPKKRKPNIKKKRRRKKWRKDRGNKKKKRRRKTRKGNKTQHHNHKKKTEKKNHHTTVTSPRPKPTVQTRVKNVPTKKGNSTKKSKGRPNIFDDESLPDYLRNRGRRQAGSKRGSKLKPGIINAPLLNQCRPGAKRDYNGHCRTKVVPRGKVPPPRRNPKAATNQPSPPRMKCKGETRLDSRGSCRKTVSGLG